MANAKTLQFLNLEDTWMATAKLHYWGLSLCDDSAATILANLACIREWGILKEGYHQWRDILLASEAFGKLIER